MDSTINSQQFGGYELHFRSLQRAGRGWAFPCSADGDVDMDAMTDQVRNNYLFARALIGIELDAPRIRTTRALRSPLSFRVRD